MAHEPTKLVLGRGEVYFDRFLPGTRIGEGERYLGNTSTFRLQRDVRTNARATSYGGRKVSVSESIISESHGIDFTTDNVDLENLALWFGTATVAQDITRLPVSETFAVKRGRYYQLGKTQNVAGVRNITEVIVKIGAAFIEAPGNYSVDRKLGRIWIEPAADDIADGVNLTVSFTVRESDSAGVGAKSELVQGSLRFLAFNDGTSATPQNDVFIPCVTLTPRGQVDLKGDEWQQWSFEGQAFNLNPSTQQVYVTRAAKTVQLTMAEETIIDEFGSFADFTPLEDLLHVSVNFEWPPALELGVI